MIILHQFPLSEMLTQFADRHFQRFHQLNRWIGFVNQTLEGHADRFRVGILFNRCARVQSGARSS
jgi:hypothetical protein